jgi:hypothetical protein
MPSNRLAFLSVAVGCALLGWATAGVSAIGSDLPKASTTPPAATQQAPDVPHRHHHDQRPGV